MTIKAGQLIAFTWGEYSDYQIGAYVRALKDFDLSETSKIIKADPDYSVEKISTRGGRNRPYTIRMSNDQVVAWLVKNGYVEATDEIREIHIDDYAKNCLFYVY